MPELPKLLRVLLPKLLHRWLPKLLRVLLPMLLHRLLQPELPCRCSYCKRPMQKLLSEKLRGGISS